MQRAGKQRGIDGTVKGACNKNPNGNVIFIVTWPVISREQVKFTPGHF